LKMEKQRYWKLLNGITDGLRPIFWEWAENRKLIRFLSTWYGKEFYENGPKQ
jgi:hypothetical protein